MAGVLAPGQRQLYWKGPVDVRVERYDLTEQFELPRALAQLLVRAKQPLGSQVADAIARGRGAGYVDGPAHRGR